MPKGNVRLGGFTLQMWKSNDRKYLSFSNVINMATLIKLQKLFLKNHPEIKESWIQDVLANNPSLLELGDIQLKDKERMQPRSGRLDLLFQHVETKRRYEVEVQLGRIV